MSAVDVMKCPSCGDKVLESHYRSGVEIDVCPHCRGVWLDRGELDRLINDVGPSPFIERPDLERRDPYEVSKDWSEGCSEPADHPGRNGREPKSKPKSKPNSKSKDSSKKRPPKKKSWGELLGDILEEVLD